MRRRFVVWCHWVAHKFSILFNWSIDENLFHYEKLCHFFCSSSGDISYIDWKFSSLFQAYRYFSPFNAKTEEKHLERWLHSSIRIPIIPSWMFTRTSRANSWSQIDCNFDWIEIEWGKIWAKIKRLSTIETDWNFVYGIYTYSLYMYVWNGKTFLSIFSAIFFKSKRKEDEK